MTEVSGYTQAPVSSHPVAPQVGSEVSHCALQQLPLQIPEGHWLPSVQGPPLVVRTVQVPKISSPRIPPLQ
jgi:hypothetical protein